MIAINVFLLLFCGLILVAVKNVATYFIIIPGIYLSYGGLYAILPTQSIRVLGPVVGSKLFGWSSWVLQLLQLFSLQYNTFS